jgi:hypothetical protein
MLGRPGELLEHFHGFYDTGITLSHLRRKKKERAKGGAPVFFSIAYFHPSLRPGALICNILARVFQFDY